MYQLKNIEDTIAAISTALGQGGINIVRLSGARALEIADQMFVAKNKIQPSKLKTYTLRHGWITDQDGKFIDEVLLTVMRAPHSYTCEDVIEISCHGGVVAVQAILSRALDLGARLAEPGEFTKRAFLHGRIDLTQAEAVLDIIQSKTEEFLRVSQNQLKGELSQELEVIREQLMNAYTEIEAIINFPEDDIEAKGREQLLASLRADLGRVQGLLESSNQGRILKEGIKIVLCGKPNVGKSSLLNVLLKQPRAIVSDMAGTTRDTIEETAQIRGIPFQLVDTAGILEPRDLIEEEAVKRSRMSIKSADLILFILDNHEPFSTEDEHLLQMLKEQNVLIVLNKSDLLSKIDQQNLQKKLDNRNILKVSALHKTGITELEEAIVASVLQGTTLHTQGILISNLRHIQSLKICLENLQKAEEILTQRLSLEFASEEIKSAINALDSITGRNIDEDLLERIFSEFCIGK